MDAELGEDVRLNNWPQLKKRNKRIKTVNKTEK